MAFVAQMVGNTGVNRFYVRIVRGLCHNEFMTVELSAPPPQIMTDVAEAASGVVDARRTMAAAQAGLAAASVHYANVRTAADRNAAGDGGPRSHCGSASPPGRVRARPGEFVPDELSIVLCEQPMLVRRLLARTRRMATDLPTVWEAHQRGEVDAEQIRVIDRVARHVTESATLAAVDAEVVDAAQTRSPKQLGAWLLRLVVRLEPLPFERRHRRALAERRVQVVQGVDGMGYVTGEVSATGAAAIDSRLTRAAHALGSDDPRTVQQRRSDVFADLLLGRLHLVDGDDPDALLQQSDSGAAEQTDDGWLEVEEIDPATGELLGTRWERVDADGETVSGEPTTGNAQPAREAPGASAAEPGSAPVPAWTMSLRRQAETLRIGVVVPLASLLDGGDAPGELSDRSATVPAEDLRQLIAETLDPDASGSDRVLFTRLLTDDGGRLLDTTELGRHASRRLAEAIRLRAGTCRFPTCRVPADRCDNDHHDPWPHGPTAAANLDPLCRRHHRAKTFAWLAAVRDDDGVDWTMPGAHRYRCADDPLPV